MVSADGRLSVDAALVLDGWTFAAGLALVVRTVALTLALLVTLGNFTLRLVLGAVVVATAAAVAAFDLVVAFVVLLVVRFVAGSVFVVVDREIVFLTPVLSVLRFLFRREADSSMTLPIFRFVVVLDCVFFALALSFFCSSLSFVRCSFSLGRGPSTPRQLAEPHRHCWTFFCE